MHALFVLKSRSEPVEAKSPNTMKRTRLNHGKAKAKWIKITNKRTAWNEANARKVHPKMLQGLGEKVFGTAYKNQGLGEKVFGTAYKNRAYKLARKLEYNTHDEKRHELKGRKNLQLQPTLPAISRNRRYARFMTEHTCGKIVRTTNGTKPGRNSGRPKLRKRKWEVVICIQHPLLSQERRRLQSESLMTLETSTTLRTRKKTNNNNDIKQVLVRANTTHHS